MTVAERTRILLRAHLSQAEEGFPRYTMVTASMATYRIRKEGSGEMDANLRETACPATPSTILAMFLVPSATFTYNLDVRMAWAKNMNVTQARGGPMISQDNRPVPR